ncbi:hypothetical protein DYB37_002211 [Aphanomyces astaci]|uniref:Uncharacterized protein n=1 Tax=Aphanomyces astaci TaxID=112090 RepID=A0A3R6YTH8_APHAT|nr:hypothetical protein DYB35_007762 [Aphanomyces astaci]RHZ23937.1 hypothetical protein DYB37_002211 [Aphanomyces astaci]
MKEPYSETEPIHRLWEEIEKKYGVSNVTTMKTATRKLMRVADGDFQSVEALLGGLRALKYSINSHSQKYLKRDVVSDDLLILVVLGVLPSQRLWGANRTAHGVVSDCRRRGELIGIFGSKSKRDIIGMDQSATSKVAGQSHRATQLHRGQWKAKGLGLRNGSPGECS